MRHDETTYKTDNNAAIYEQQWLPDGEPRAVVCLVHGHGEHSGRYNNVIDVLVDQQDLAVLSFDLRGHGKSSGTRGDLRFDDAMDDIDHLLARARAQFPTKPIILYGHSLGGLLTMTHMLERRPEVTAHVVTAPLLDTQLREQTVKVALANVLGSALPGLTLGTGGDPTGISRDEAEVKAYVDDTMVHDKASFAFAKQSLAAMANMQETTEYPVPLLMLHGTGDIWTIPAASREFVERVDGDLTLYQYEDLYHELHHELEKDQILGDIADWLNDVLDN